MRIALGIEYDGSQFLGWQAQSHTTNTIQYAVEQALSRVANHPIQVTCAGRTDAGVHASGQVVHFDSDSPRTMDAWLRGTNSNLPDAVAVQWAAPVPDEFHARFSAVRRRYRFVIFNRAVRPTFLAFRTTWHYHALDEARMQRAAEALVGQHDFNAYRTVACQAKTSVRTIYALEIKRQGPFVMLEIEADGFLHHMVRNIAGVLMAIGNGEHQIEWAREILESRDRTQGGVTAPAFGLYLTQVTYPPQFALPTFTPTSLVW